MTGAEKIIIKLISAKGIDNFPIHVTDVVDFYSLLSLTSLIFLAMHYLQGTRAGKPVRKRCFPALLEKS